MQDPLRAVEIALEARINPEKAAFFPRFFKSGYGEYAEGDKFLGVTVPEQRNVAKKFYRLISISDTCKLLKSKWHEHRLTALFILVYKFEKANYDERTQIYHQYLKHAGPVGRGLLAASKTTTDHTSYINNWDLVDSSAHKIVGSYNFDNKNRLVMLEKLADSPVLWERRIAVIATMWFIKNGQPEDTIILAKKLLGDEHDLIHKAVGWMLREVGKNIDSKILMGFLDEHAHEMPRTTLRYSIEKLPESQRQAYLQKK